MNSLYKVVQIPGKDLGCVALKDIKKGTLILREIPQCFAQGSGPAQIGKWITFITLLQILLILLFLQT